MKFIAPLFALLFLAAPAKAGFVLNGQGPSGVYSLFRITPNGAMTNPTAIIGPSGSGFDASHVYWPSAVLVGSTLRVYASAQDASGNISLGLWTSTNGINFTRVGQVLAPISGEGQIGGAHVLYDAADSVAPYKMWFGTNYGTRPVVIKYATSTDGVIWTRQGTVITASQPYETSGFQLDFVCYDAASSLWRMWYDATGDSGATFQAIEATASSPGGPWTKVGPVLSPVGGSAYTVSSTVTPGSRYLRLNTTSGLNVGGVYVLGNGTVSERVVIEAVLDGDEASIKDAMVSSGSNFTLRPVDMKKVAMSSFWRDSNGVGRAVFTGWGAGSGALMEYAFEGYQSGGAFVRDFAAPARFKPTGPGSLYSFENPSLIKSGPEC